VLGGGGRAPSNLTPAPDGREQSASPLGRFAPGEGPPVAYRTGKSVGPTDGPDLLENRQFSPSVAISTPDCFVRCLDSKLAELTRLRLLLEP
jgi:hypothetical protein